MNAQTSTPSQLGTAVRQARLARGLSLRQLAKFINKSPSYLVALERSPSFPGSADATLTAIAEALDLNADVLFSLANRSPEALKPVSATEFALHRLLKQLNDDEQQILLNDLLRRFAKKE